MNEMNDIVYPMYERVESLFLKENAYNKDLDERKEQIKKEIFEQKTSDYKLPENIKLVYEMGYDNLENGLVKCRLPFSTNSIWHNEYSKYSSREYNIDYGKLDKFQPNKFNRPCKPVYRRKYYGVVKYSLNETEYRINDRAKEEFDNNEVRRELAFMGKQDEFYHNFYAEHKLDNLPSHGINTNRDDFEKQHGGKFVSNVLDSENINKSLEVLLNGNMAKEITPLADGSIKFDISFFNKDKKKLGNLTKLLALFENSLYYVGFGSQKFIPQNLSLNKESTMDEYAHSIRNKVLDDIDYINKQSTSPYACYGDLIPYLVKNGTRKAFELDDNILSINCLSNCNNINVWIIYTMVYSNLINYAASDEFDDKYVNYMLKNTKKTNIVSEYKTPDVWSLLDMADLTFKNQQEKLLFIGYLLKDKSFDGYFDYSSNYKDTKDIYDNEILNKNKCTILKREYGEDSKDKDNLYDTYTNYSTVLKKHKEKEKTSGKYDIVITSNTFDSYGKWYKLIKVVSLYNEIFYHFGLDTKKVMPLLVDNCIENDRVKIDITRNLSMGKINYIEPIRISASKFIDEDKLKGFQDFWSAIIDCVSRDDFDIDYINYIVKNLNQKYVNTNYDKIEKSKKRDFETIFFDDNLYKIYDFSKVIDEHVDKHDMFHKYQDTKDKYEDELNIKKLVK